MNELDYAEKILVRLVQKRFFQKEFQALSHGLLVSPELRKLSIFIDDSDKIKIIRICGRLMNQKELPFETKRPALLPQLFQKDTESKYKVNFIILLMERVHKENLHAGPKLSTLMLKRRYWVLNAYKGMQHIIHRCQTCFMQKTFTPSVQIMGHIPEVTQNSSIAFLTSSVDFCGPFNLRETRNLRKTRIFKVYICVITCKFTRATWLELCMNADTTSFMLALKRFLSRAGQADTFELDNGSNFKGASNELERQFKQIIKNCAPDIVAELSKFRIKFNFRPPFSPHLTGTVEACVGRVKKLLKRTIIDTSDYDIETFSTVLCEIQGVLNSAPLCRDSSDPTSFSFLSPAHLFICKPLSMLPEYPIQESNPVKLYQKLRSLVDRFYEYYIVERFAETQVRNKWERRIQNFQVDDLVLLRNHYSDSKRLWPRAIVTKVIIDADGVSRFLMLRTASGEVLKRHLKDVILIPGIDQIELPIFKFSSMSDCESQCSTNGQSKKGDKDLRPMISNEKRNKNEDIIPSSFPIDQQLDSIGVKTVSQLPPTNQHGNLAANLPILAKVSSTKLSEKNKNKTTAVALPANVVVRRSERIKQRRDKKCVK